MADEEWKNLPVFDGRSFSRYEVSSLGRIRNKKAGYVFSARPNSEGYVYNGFYDDEGNYNSMSVHGIVSRAFLDEPKSANLTVDHINRERADNRVANLRWATKEQQAANSNRSKYGATGQPVIQYTMDMEEIKKWPNIITAAKELKINNGRIGTACKGKRDQTGVFKWAYERQDLDGEIWRDYKPMDIQVSNMGRIKSPHYHIVYGSKIGDYLTYGKPQKLVHIIVAEAFLSNLENKLEVNHKDKDGTNNKLENLEWVTRSEQMIHSHRTNSDPNRYSTALAVKQYIWNPSDPDVEGVDIIGEYRSIGQASRETGCSESSISRVCEGISKSTKGFIFKYANENVLNRPAITCSKKVDFFIEDGNVIDVYDSVKVAALDLGISHHSIYDILSGTTVKSRDGYRFRYH